MKQYWGPHEEYGPFSKQEDGWPNQGEVVRHYRTQKRMSAKYLGHLYGMKIQGKPVSERWIQMLEKHNLVPKDESKRRALAELLSIPPILLGLGSIGNLLPQKKARASVSSIDLSTLPHYSRVLDLYWTLDYTSSAQSSLSEVEGITTDLRAISSQVTGDNQNKVYELLCGFYPLISTVYCDQKQYSLAFDNADQAVKIAETMKNNKLTAVALFQRGFVNLQRGQGSQGQIDKGYIQAAIDDLEAALPLAIPRVEIGILMDLARAYALLKQLVPATNALQKADKIIVRRDLVDGSFIDLFANVDFGRYHLGRGAVFVLLHEPDEADAELDLASELVRKDQTRRHAWIDILRAQNLFNQKQYVVAASTALGALKISQDIQSGYNIGLVGDLYTAMPEKALREQTVRDLGASLLRT